jgi:hypothetical protein
MWDKFACIRSLIAAPEHSDHETHTGYSEATNPFRFQGIIFLQVSRLPSIAVTGVRRRISSDE